jgi:zinc protease
MSVADVEAWPERLKKITVDDVRNVARKYLVERNSVTGVLSPPAKTSGQKGAQPAHAS